MAKNKEVEKEVGERVYVRISMFCMNGIDYKAQFDRKLKRNYFILEDLPEKAAKFVLKKRIAV